MRTYRAFVLRCLIVLSVMAGQLCAQNEIGGYTKEVVVTLPWGTEPGEIGYYDRTNRGPSSFAIGEENSIYLLDCGNRRVQIFDETGNLITYFGLIEECLGLSSIAYDAEQGTVYVSSDEQISIYATNGTIIKTIYWRDAFAEDPIVVENGIIFFGMHTFTKAIVLNETIKTGKVGRGGEELYSAYPSRDATLLRINPYNKYTQATYGLDATAPDDEKRLIIHTKDNTYTSMDIRMIPPEYSVRFMRDTIQGDIILYASARHGGQLVARLYKFNRNFELVSIVDDKELGMVSSGVVDSMKITDDGTVYKLVADGDGARIVKWTMK